jgi:hypothetical protein
MSGEGMNGGAPGPKRCHQARIVPVTAAFKAVGDQAGWRW